MDATITTDGIAATLARHQDGYLRLDAAALAANYAEDCVLESMIAGRHVGRDAVERIFLTLFSAFPDLRIEVQWGVAGRLARDALGAQRCEGVLE